MIPTYAIVIRHATDCDHDQRVLSELAALDSRMALNGPALIAEVDGVARAALDLSDASVAADPFAHTVELVELLRLRAGSLVQPVSLASALRARLGTVVRNPRAARVRA